MGESFKVDFAEQYDFEKKDLVLRIISVLNRAALPRAVSYAPLIYKIADW